MVRSEPWRRTTNPQKRTALKLLLLRAYSASAGPFPRSPATKTPSRDAVTTMPRDGLGYAAFPKRTAEREWSAASLGGEQQIPKSAQRESSSSSEPTQRAQDRSRGLKRTAEREWSAASLGGEQQIPKSAQR